MPLRVGTFKPKTSQWCSFIMDYGLDANYWQRRYERGKTGWDLGHLSSAMKYIIDQLRDKNLKILVPGGGNAFEVEYLWSWGFRNVFLLDWAEAPLQNFADRNRDFPRDQILMEDFFDLEGQFDLVLEQTFFCSLLPTKRRLYVEKTSALLLAGGQLKGVLFNVPLYSDRPPFGGSKKEYRKLFSSHFEILKMEECRNSEEDRMGMELEIEMVKKPL